LPSSVSNDDLIYSAFIIPETNKKILNLNVNY
jgi:hypothetical protein